MSLKFSDIIQKAKNKGIGDNYSVEPNVSKEIIRPWQHDSVLFNPEQKKAVNKLVTKTDRGSVSHENPNNDLKYSEDSTEKTGKNYKGVIKESKRSPKGVIKESKRSPKGVQKESKRSHKGVQKESKRSHKGVIKESIKESDFNRNKEHSNQIQRLSGHQKKIFYFMLDRCCDRGSLDTGPIGNTTISELCNSTQKTIKTQIKRLEIKRLIKREKGKRARGGFTVFSIDEEVKNIALSAKRYARTNNHINGLSLNPKGVIKESIKESERDVVSSSNITTTTEKLKTFPSIDLDCLLDEGLTLNHLIQVEREYSNNPEIALPEESVQESIYALAYDLKNNRDQLKIKSTPVGMLINLLKKGRPYSSITPDKYLNPTEDALDKYLKSQANKQQRVEAMQAQLFTVEFDKWLENLTDSEKNQLLDDKQQAEINRMPKSTHPKVIRGYLKGFFTLNAWPELKAKIIPTVADASDIQGEDLT